MSAAKTNRPDFDAELFDFFGRILLLEIRGPLETDLVMRFQQSTGPVMAKGVEDTLFYNYNRFVALNDVGSEPNRFAISAEDFHRRNQETLTAHPHTMLATTTHDTKRGEDVRMRLALLSEMPQRWTAAVRSLVAKKRPASYAIQAGQESGVFVLPDPGWSVADLGRSNAFLFNQGGSRSQAIHDLDHAE